MAEISQCNVSLGDNGFEYSARVTSDALPENQESVIVRWFIDGTLAAVDGPLPVSRSFGAAFFEQPRPTGNTTQGRVEIRSREEAVEAVGLGDKPTSTELEVVG